MRARQAAGKRRVAQPRTPDTPAAAAHSHALGPCSAPQRQHRFNGHEPQVLLEFSGLEVGATMNRTHRMKVETDREHLCFRVSYRPASSKLARPYTWLDVPHAFCRTWPRSMRPFKCQQRHPQTCRLECGFPCSHWPRLAWRARQ